MLFRRSQIPEAEFALLQRASDWGEHRTLDALDGETLGRITSQHGVDFATALLFDRFQKSPRHKGFIERIDQLRKSDLPPREKIPAKVIIVPGALYLERPDMGGDGKIVRRVAESLGYETDLIPLASFGSVAKNASLIRAWFKEHSKDNVILVSLSKGGSDLRTALQSNESVGLFENVLAWINVGGPLNGSRMADWVMANGVRALFCRTKFYVQRRDFRFITELCHDRISPSSAAFSVQPSMRIINVIGFPLARHMTTRFSRFCHRTLARWGPNDGTTALSDACQWPGEIYPVWGADHYFRPENVASNLITALFHYLGEDAHLFSQASRREIALTLA
jgi:hypothetical protein